ncbi:peptidylprolyl isomerase [Malassezia yamatoensis]|uniref:Peptidyl-prolyl cis-trans isomerase n=1 Tax=Malassezia yamatoensis TaxID=253288 RepID=A0AAJ5YX62_9BASI|nr:peptidylprolyl isomerase [Malassezia yamatoensis]
MDGIQQLSAEDSTRRGNGNLENDSDSTPISLTPTVKDASTFDTRGGYEENAQLDIEAENGTGTVATDATDAEKAGDEAEAELQAQKDAEEEAAEEERRRNNASAAALTLEIVGDLPHADVKPPENILFVCKLNPVTKSEDLELIFSRFGEICSCEVIRDKKTGDSLQYAFVEYEERQAAERAYSKMQNVLIDDRRIWVDFSQSVSRLHNVWVKQRTGMPSSRKDSQSSSARSGRANASNATLMRPEYNTQDVLVDLDSALENQYAATTRRSHRQDSPHAYNDRRRSHYSDSSRSRGHREDGRSSSRDLRRTDTHTSRHSDRSSSHRYPAETSERRYSRSERSRDDSTSGNRPYYERCEFDDRHKHDSYRSSDTRRHDHDRRHRHSRHHDDRYHTSASSERSWADRKARHPSRSQSP